MEGGGAADGLAVRRRAPAVASLVQALQRQEVAVWAAPGHKDCSGWTPLGLQGLQGLALSQLAFGQSWIYTEAHMLNAGSFITITIVIIIIIVLPKQRDRGAGRSCELMQRALWKAHTDLYSLPLVPHTALWRPHWQPRKQATGDALSAIRKGCNIKMCTKCIFSKISETTVANIIGYFVQPTKFLPTGNSEGVQR